MFTRRTILTGAAGLALATTADKAVGQATTRVRYNVATPPGQAMLAVYATAVARMKALPATDPRSWYFSWYTHYAPLGNRQIAQVFGSDTGPAYQLAKATWNTCQAHSNAANEPYFVFWHRLYVMYLERMIASMAGVPAFTLPYWDYTTPANAAIPPEFRKPNDPIWATLFQPNRNVAGNGFANVNQGDPIDKYAPGALELTALGQSDYLSFNQMLDQGLHGNVHVLTGNSTNMGYVPTAAEDPVFWLHHANIDRIWYAWSVNGGVDPTTYTQPYTFTNPDGTPAVVPLNSVAQIASLDYRYDTLPKAPTTLATTAALTAGPAGRERVLLSSAPGERLAASAPIVLGAAPSVISLAPIAGAPSLLASVRAKTAGPKRLQLILRGVTAAAPPGTVFTVYLNLPAGVTPTSAAATPYRVGTLNFFDSVAMPGMEGMGDMPGRDRIFDLTALVRRLGDRLAGRTVVTIVASGTPRADSVPAIKGSVEVTGQ